MDNIKELSNKEILEQVEILSKNHEQIKQEMLILNELLSKIEEEYVELMSELKKRK